MWRSVAISFVTGRFHSIRPKCPNFSYSTYTNTIMQHKISGSTSLLQDHVDHKATASGNSVQDVGGMQKYHIGENVSRKDKIDFLIQTLRDLKDSKEAVYCALDAWVAWEHQFPIASIKRALLTLEKEQQWHRVIQVIKWILSKGQGNTMGTYFQLIRALDMDHRVEEAQSIWLKKIGTDLHSVPWQLCKLMISIYYRNNMLESLVKLFKDLEAFGRKPSEKSIVQKVANAYEMLGRLEEKDCALQKYNDLFTKSQKGDLKKFSKTSKKNSVQSKNTSKSDSGQ